MTQLIEILTAEEKEERSQLGRKKLAGIFISLAMGQMSDHPAFLNAILMRLKIKEEESVGTAGVDNLGNLYYSPLWFAGLPEKEIYGVLLHETMHILLEHVNRGKSQGFNPQIHNIATDAMINARLIKEKYSLPNGGINTQKGKKIPVEEHETTEEIYHRIYEEEKKEMEKDKGQGQGGEGEESENSQGGDEEGNKGTHKEWSKEDLSNGQTAKKMIEKAAKEVAEQSLNNNFDYCKKGSPLDKHLLEVILKDDGEDWGAHCEEFVQSAVNNIKDNWRKRNRISKMLETQIGNKAPYLPIKQNNSIGHIVVAIDTSGSISGLYKEFAEKLWTIVNKLQCSATVVCCDCKIHNSFLLTPDSGTKTIEFNGGGGTDFAPVFEWVKDNQELGRIDGLIYLTDGYGDCQHSEPDYPVLWVSTGSQDFHPWGKIVKWTL